MTPEMSGAGATVLSPEAASGTARDDRRVRVEAEIEETAVNLFAARGFEAVTIDEIAEAAGISRRTFFRYFGSKEDLLLRDMRRRVDGYIDALEQRPGDEPVLVSLRAAAMTMVAGYQADRDSLLTLMRVIAEEPAILARNIGEPIALMDRINKMVAARIGTDATTDLRPMLIATGVAQACHLALHMWILNPGTDCSVLAARALDLVEPGLELIVAAPPTGI
jgi:AcrR family transcriptional regulator